jgi:uncharacterized protein YggE
MKKISYLTAAIAATALVLAGCSGSAETAAQSNGASPAAGQKIVQQAAAPGDVSVEPAAVAVGAPATPSGLRSVTAQGIGKVSGTPDVVTIGLGVETRATSAKSALNDNSKRAAAVIDVLKKSGVAPADLQTSQLSIQPSYDKDSQVITGYQVTNMVTAKLHDIAGAGAVIDAVSAAAGDAVRVQQLTFSIDDDSALRAKARAAAVTQAQAQAKQMADAAGIRLGAVHSIVESPSSTPVVYQATDRASTAGAPAPIEPGSQELSVVVQVIYEIAS